MLFMFGYIQLKKMYKNYQKTQKKNEPTEEQMMDYQQFAVNYLLKGDVVGIQIWKQYFQKGLEYIAVVKVKNYTKTGEIDGTKDRFIIINDPESFVNKIEKLQRENGKTIHDFVPLRFRTKLSEQRLINKVILGAYAAVLIMAAYMLIKSNFSGLMSQGPGKGGGGGGGGKNIQNLFNSQNKKDSQFKQQTDQMKILFSDVAGLEQAKIEISEFVDFLKNTKKYNQIGAKIPKGCLIYGPPGTGKTLLAKASAGEAGVPFFFASGSEFVEMFVGVGASRIRDIFNQAKAKQPSIIFIDEIDAVGRKRSNKFSSNEERDSTLNQLLVEMDGFQSSNQVIVLAATNRIELLDPALTRAGRFDRKIEIQLPNITERKEIFDQHLKGIPLDPKYSIDEYSRKLSALTPGFSGAQINNLCNESAILAARNNKKIVSIQQFETTTERLLAGLKSSQMIQSRQERNVVAVHESGHAVVSWFLKGGESLLKLTIIPRTGALGFTQYLPDENNLVTTKQLIDRMCCLLGGRIAELEFFGDVTTGASDDLQKVTKIAQSYVTQFGMSKKLNNQTFQVGQFGEKSFSEQTGQMIDQEVKKLIEKCTKKAAKVIKKHKKKLRKLANLLLKKETIQLDDIIKILGKRPFKQKNNIKQFLEFQKGPSKKELQRIETDKKEKKKLQENNDDKTKEAECDDGNGKVSKDENAEEQVENQEEKETQETKDQENEDKEIKNEDKEMKNEDKEMQNEEKEKKNSEKKEEEGKKEKKEDDKDGKK